MRWFKTRTRRPHGSGEGQEQSINLPQPPFADPHRPSGRSQDDARQMAQRDIASGAVDAISIEAGEGPLRYDRLRDRERDVELQEAKKLRDEALTIGMAFIEEARTGLPSELGSGSFIPQTTKERH